MEDKILIKGNEISYEIEGNGPDTIVFIHSVAFDKSIWDEQVKHFSSKYKTIRFDFKGHGKSKINEPEPKYDLETSAKELAKILDELNVKNPYLVGWGTGGLVALKTEIDDLVKTKGIILLSSAIKLRIKPKAKAYLKIILEKPEISIKIRGKLDKVSKAVDQTILNAYLKSYAKIDLSNDAPYIATPVIIILGSEDGFITTKDAEES
ncbi:MAG: alpha/beta fold hydrolase, partial [Promethearchaeota archaeon]